MEEDMEVDLVEDRDETNLRLFEIKRCKSLVEAAEEGDFPDLVNLLDSGVSVNAEEYNKSLFYSSKYYVTPLHVAAENNHLSCVRRLLECGADANCRDRFDVTAVHVAAENGNLDILRELLDAGADCSVPTKFSKKHSYTAVPHVGGTTPLHLASDRNHVECVKTLIQSGADYNAIDEKGRTSLYIASQNGFSDCVLAHLRTAIGKDILSLPGFESGDTPLHFAVQNGMVECVEELLNFGSDPNHMNYAGMTPLHCAVYPTSSTQEETAEKILSLLVLKGHNIDVNLPDRAGFTPLHYVSFNSGARFTRRAHWAQFLISFGADPNIKNQRGYSLVESEVKSNFGDKTILNAIVQCQMEPPKLVLPPQLASYTSVPPPAIMQSAISFYILEEYGYEHMVAKLHHVNVKKKIQWYLLETVMPRSLQHHCRCSVRKTLGNKRLRHIKDLPVPRKIQNYLLLQNNEFCKSMWS